MKALKGVNKVEKMLDIWHAGKLFYTLAMWGIALARLVLKFEEQLYWLWFVLHSETIVFAEVRNGLVLLADVLLRVWPLCPVV